MADWSHYSKYVAIRLIIHVYPHLSLRPSLQAPRLAPHAHPGHSTTPLVRCCGETEIKSGSSLFEAANGAAGSSQSCSKCRSIADKLCYDDPVT